MDGKCKREDNAGKYATIGQNDVALRGKMHARCNQRRRKMLGWKSHLGAPFAFLLGHDLELAGLKRRARDAAAVALAIGHHEVGMVRARERAREVGLSVILLEYADVAEAHETLFRVWKKERDDKWEEVRATRAESTTARTLSGRGWGGRA